MTVEVINEVTNVVVTQSGPTNVEVGAPGIQGAIGPPNVLTVGAVDTLSPSSPPTVSITGASPTQTINFGIPAGAQILRGTATPATSLGQVGFWYINTSNWDVYEKTADTVWTNRGNIKGATGNTGPAPNLTIGTVALAAAGEAPTATITGTNPSYSLNLNFPLANWTIGTTTSLVPGSAATSSVTGTALNPVLNIGVPRGAAILNGTTAPASGTGSQGDWYFNTVTSDLYEKTSSTVWTLRQNLKGATGNTGNTGPANSLSIGTVTTGAVGSSASATITGTAPTQTLNLTLPTGATGPTGPAPNMAIGTVTTLAAGASATATVTGTNPNYSLNLGLPQGLKGDIGAQWYAGTGVPSAGTGVNGDFYLIASGTGVGDVYKKVSGSWGSPIGNIRGQAGSGDVESVNGVLPVGGNVTLTWSNFTGTIPTSALPSLATVETYTVASQAAMLATGAQRGDLAIRTDIDETYILSGNDPAVLGNWTQLLTDGGNVRLTGDQSIGGIKTFTSAPVVPDASWTIAKTSGLQAALDLKAPLANPTFTGTVSGITKAMVGLGNVTNAAQVELTGAQTIAGVKTFSSAPVVPDASFTIAKTSGLQSALDGKAAVSHTHAATEIISGTLDIARIPTGTTGTTVALGNHLHTGVYEPLIAAGTTAQYRRGDNTWATLNVAAVAGAAPLYAPQFTGQATFSRATFGAQPEGEYLASPVLMNDLANARLRGSTFSVTGSSLSNSQFDAMFSGLADFASFPMPLTGPVTIEFTLPKTLRYSSWVGVNFGTTSWTTAVIRIEAFSEGVWKDVVNETSNSVQSIGGPIPSNAGTGTTALRVTIDQPNGSQVRIAHIWGFDYASHMWSQLQMPRAGGSFYGNISMGGDNFISGIPTPTSSDHAVPKGYVDSLSYSLSSSSITGILPVSKGGTGSTTQNFVDLTSSQVIGGAKTFSSAPTLSSLTASRVVTTGTGGALGVSAVTTTELGYLSGVTSAVQTQINGKAATVHGHVLTDANITGVLPIAQIPVGTTQTTVARGDHNHNGVYEPVLSVGTTAQYYRGDKSWQTLNTAAVGLGNVTNEAQATKVGGGKEAVAALSATTGTATGDLSNASIFTVTPTGAITLAFSNVPASGTSCTVTLIVSQGSTAYAVTYPTGTVWIGASAPTQAANKKCVITLMTVDGGTSWLASAAVQQ